MPTVDLAAIEEYLAPLERWAYQCHAASFHLVDSVNVVGGPLDGRARVARGTGGIGSQHSWVVLGDDCYDRDATIIDPTLWGYRDDIDGIWVGTMRDGIHKPHGMGSIWEWGRPDTPTGPIVELTPREPWSPEARSFLELLGPLDERGWHVLAHAPVEEWPSAEIIPAIADAFPAIVPIDIIGMLTDDNPGGVYLPNGGSG